MLCYAQLPRNIKKMYETLYKNNSLRKKKTFQIHISFVHSFYVCLSSFLTFTKYNLKICCCQGMIIKNV